MTSATEGAMWNLQGLMDLQLFADPDPAPDNGLNPDTKNEPGKGADPEPEPEPITMTKEEFETALQKEADRRVTQAVKKRDEEFKQRLEKETAAARKEAEELAKLSAEERAKVEKEKAEMEAERERREFQEEKKAFAHEKLQMEATKQLAERKLPIEFAPYIYGETAEDTFERITTFEKQWQEALEVAVKDRLRGPVPKGQPQGKRNYFTKEQVEKMTHEEVIANMTAIEESAKQW